MNFWIGTSDFSTRSGKGTFIPKICRRRRCFRFTPSNSPRRRSTTPFTAFLHRRRSKIGRRKHRRDFVCLKAPQKITHWSKLRECADTLDILSKWLRSGERLGPVLFQLPPTFKKDADVLAHSCAIFPQCAPRSNSATSPGSMTKFLICSARGISRSASPIQTQLRRREDYRRLRLSSSSSRRLQRRRRETLVRIRARTEHKLD